MSALTQAFLDGFFKIADRRTKLLENRKIHQTTVPMGMTRPTNLARRKDFYQLAQPVKGAKKARNNAIAMSKLTTKTPVKEFVSRAQSRANFTYRQAAHLTKNIANPRASQQLGRHFDQVAREAEEFGKSITKTGPKVTRTVAKTTPKATTTAAKVVKTIVKKVL